MLTFTLIGDDFLYIRDIVLGLNRGMLDFGQFVLKIGFFVESL